MRMGSMIGGFWSILLEGKRVVCTELCAEAAQRPESTVFWIMYDDGYPFSSPNVQIPKGLDCISVRLAKTEEYDGAVDGMLISCSTCRSDILLVLRLAFSGGLSKYALCDKLRLFSTFFLESCCPQIAETFEFS